MVFLSEENFLSWLETCRVQESVIVSNKSLGVVISVINKKLNGKTKIKDVESIELGVNINGTKKLISVRCRIKEQ